MSARGQLHPRLRGRTRSSRSKQTDIRTLDPSRLPEPPDFATIDVSFISLKLVLPAIGKLARSARNARRADQAAIRGRRAATSRKASCAIAAVHAAVCDDIAAFLASLRLARRRRHALADPRRRRQSRILHRGRAWLSGSRSTGIGHRGDGIADGAGGPIYVPGALPGETVEVEQVAGHPDRRQLASRRRAERRAHRADLPAFRRVRRLRRAALGRCALSRVEARPRRRGAAAGRPRCAGRRPHRRAWRRPPPRRVPCPARQPRRARGRLLRRARAHIVADRPLPGFGPEPRRRDQRRLGDRRSARARRTSRSTSR